MNYIEKVRKDLSFSMSVESDLLDLYTLLCFSKGVRCTKEDVHDAWAIWRTKKDPKHRSLIPFVQLSPEVQEMDQEYAVAIRRTAAQNNL